MNKRQTKKFHSSIGIPPKKRKYRNTTNPNHVIVVKNYEIHVKLRSGTKWSPQLKHSLQREMRANWMTAAEEKNASIDLFDLIAGDWSQESIDDYNEWRTARLADANEPINHVNKTLRVGFDYGSLTPLPVGVNTVT